MRCGVRERGRGGGRAAEGVLANGSGARGGGGGPRGGLPSQWGSRGAGSRFPESSETGGGAAGEWGRPRPPRPRAPSDPRFPRFPGPAPRSLPSLGRGDRPGLGGPRERGPGPVSSATRVPPALTRPWGVPAPPVRRLFGGSRCFGIRAPRDRRCGPPRAVGVPALSPWDGAGASPADTPAPPGPGVAAAPCSREGSEVPGRGGEDTSSKSPGWSRSPAGQTQPWPWGG